MEQAAFEQFVQDLRLALNSLYDPVELRSSSLVASLGLEQRDDPVSALRWILLGAIRSLQPQIDVPIQSSAWRYYRILFSRYTEQLIQQEVASDLGLSIRQLRRQERLALETLAHYLWSHYPVEARQAGGKAATTIPVPSRKQELEWSQSSLPSAPVSVEEMVLAVVRIAEQLCQVSGVRIESAISANLPHLAVQLAIVQQALLGILTTAIRRVPGGSLRLEAETHRQELWIQVSYPGDTGRQSDEGIKMAGELIEFSGGRLDVVETAGSPDPCTSIRLVLPVRTPIRVLAIDDNPDTLQLWQRYISGTQYELIAVRDPDQALLRASETYPHIIVQDVMLPNIDGWDLLGRLREHPMLRGVPIIVCTILPQEQLALALGAAAFLRKPISRQVFLVTLDAQTDLLDR